MKKQYLLVAALLCIVAWGSAQSTTGTPVQVVETMYLIPKKGMEEKFEAAVKAHDQKFHPAGPYVAGLRKVEYGAKAGWYVWVFGPTSYSSLDTRPAKENGHAQDWSTTVDPLVEEYGASTLWNYNADLSYGWDIFLKSKYAETWMVNLKPGQYYRFKELAAGLQKAFESIGTTAFLVFENQVHVTNGPDVGLVWSFNSYQEWSEDAGLMAAYEKINGKGTWQNLMTEWRDIIVDYDAEIRTVLN